MGVVARKSGVITNRDATPQVKSNSSVQGGLVKSCSAVVEVVTGDSSTSTYRMLQVPSNARIKSLLIHSDDMGTATAADFGIANCTADGGSVIDADFFKAAQSLNGGALAGTEILHGNAYNVDEIEKPLWEAMGLTSDPHLVYDVIATLTADSDTGGTLALEMEYV